MRAVCLALLLISGLVFAEGIDQKLNRNCQVSDGRTFVRHYSCPRGTYATEVRVLTNEKTNLPVVQLRCTEIIVRCEGVRVPFREQPQEAF